MLAFRCSDDWPQVEVASAMPVAAAVAELPPPRKPAPEKKIIINPPEPTPPPPKYLAPRPERHRFTWESPEMYWEEEERE